MSRALAVLGALVAYFCIATVLAAGVCAGYLWSRGYLREERVLKMLAVAQGRELAASPGAGQAVAEDQPQASLEEIALARAAKARDLELREQSLRNHLERVKFEQAKLEDQNDRYNRIRTAFLNELESLRAGSIATNQENARLILETIKPKQAKEQILRMLDAGEMQQVVVLLSQMPITRRAKIAAEFKSEEEAGKLAELLKTIREGVPEVPLVDATKKELDETTQPEK